MADDRITIDEEVYDQIYYESFERFLADPTKRSIFMGNERDFDMGGRRSETLRMAADFFKRGNLESCDFSDFVPGPEEREAFQELLSVKTLTRATFHGRLWETFWEDILPYITHVKIFAIDEIHGNGLLRYDTLVKLEIGGFNYRNDVLSDYIAKTQTLRSFSTFTRDAIDSLWDALEVNQSIECLSINFSGNAVTAANTIARMMHLKELYINQVIRWVTGRTSEFSIVKMRNCAHLVSARPDLKVFFVEGHGLSFLLYFPADILVPEDMKLPIQEARERFGLPSDIKSASKQ